MDKKILINVLKNDFRVLVKERPSVDKAFQKDSDFIFQTQIENKEYFYFLSDTNLKKVVRVGNGKEKVEFTFSVINDNIAKNIQILHKNFNLSIALKAI